MPVSLDPITCACGRVVGYQIRMGREHESAEARDPYEGVCLALHQQMRLPVTRWHRLMLWAANQLSAAALWCDRQLPRRQWAYVALAHGRISRSDYWDTVRQLVALGYEWVAYEHDGEVSTVTRIDMERRNGRTK